MPKLNIWVAGDNSSDIFVVIVEVPQIFLSKVYFKGVFIFVEFFGPLINCHDFIKAHDHVDYYIFVFKASFSTFDDGLSHVKVCEETAIDQHLFVEPNDWENNWDAGAGQNGLTCQTEWCRFIKDDDFTGIKIH